MVNKAMIMAAGVGSRLDPLTRNVPKPLIPVANQPVMDLLLKHLKKFGITDMIANTHYLAEQIQDRYSENEFGVNFNYIREIDLSGTAGGVKKCQGFFESGETFVVMSADGLTDANLSALIESHKKSGAIATMGLKEVPKDEVSHYGVVVTDENNLVTEFQEKPAIEEAKSNLVNTGIYIFEYKIFDYIPANTFYDFAKQVFPSLMQNGEKINTCVVRDYWSDIGTLNQYRLSTDDILELRMNVDFPYEQKPYGWAAQDSNINENALLSGNLLVGNGSSIESGAKLEGNCVVGNNCVIKEGAVLINSIIWDNVIIEKGAILEDCIIANNTIIQENTTLEKGAVIASDSVISPCTTTVS